MVRLCSGHVGQGRFRGNGRRLFRLALMPGTGARPPGRDSAPVGLILLAELAGALYVARAEDPTAAREECVAILDRILHGLIAGT